jgi:hypothetical protein
MKRRDLLLLRATPRARVFELPCERLYMRFVDLRRPPPTSTSAPPDYWLGEPDAQFDVRTPHDLFEALARELSAADVVRVVGQEWLADTELKQEVERLMAAFAERGGRVQRG